MQEIIAQVQSQTNFLGYVKTKKVVEILENSVEEKQKDTRKRSGKYMALYLKGYIIAIGNKTKMLGLFKFLSEFNIYDHMVLEITTYTEYKKRKKEGYFYL